jgi:fructose-1-phosphate kinase PfkB-like protein
MTLFLSAIVFATAYLRGTMATVLNQKQTLVIGLNPALQRTVTLAASLQVGSVNRGSSVQVRNALRKLDLSCNCNHNVTQLLRSINCYQVGIGGKGQDVIVASVSMNANPPPVLLQFLGTGAEGDTLAGLIQTLQQSSSAAAAVGISESSSSLSIRTSTPCRTCVTLVDRIKGEATEIVEPSGTISQSEIDSLLSALDAQFKVQKASGVAVMGSMPPGCPADLYSQILKRVCDANTKVQKHSLFLFNI